MSDYREAREQGLTMEVATAILAQEIESDCQGMLSLRLGIGSISSQDLKPICGGRPTYALALEVDYHTDDWTFADSENLCQGVADFFREWQRRIDGMVDRLSRSIPEFAEAWKGGAR